MGTAKSTPTPILVAKILDGTQKGPSTLGKPSPIQLSKHLIRMGTTTSLPWFLASVLRITSFSAFSLKDRRFQGHRLG